MINQHIEVTPCSPQIDMQQPNFTSNEDSKNGRLSPVMKSGKKISTASFNTSLDTDDDVAASLHQLHRGGGGGDNTSQEYEHEENSNARYACVCV